MRKSKHANSSKESETVINNFTKDKSSDLDGFTGKFYQNFKEDFLRLLVKLF